MWTTAKHHAQPHNDMMASTAASAEKKVARRKKKRISKHVMKAKEAQQEGSPANTHETTTKRQSKAKKAKRQVKDPNEAASYLSAWKHRNAGGAWKFNKNTQSWLVRHCYEPEKVSKATFTTFLEYVEELQGETRKRTIADAKRRALRYKEFEKEKPQQQDSAQMTKDHQKEEDSSSKQVVEDEDDEVRWKHLNAHEKRKEYKRARKVLDVLKV